MRMLLCDRCTNSNPITADYIDLFCRLYNELLFQVDYCFGYNPNISIASKSIEVTLLFCNNAIPKFTNLQLYKHNFFDDIGDELRFVWFD